MAETLSPISADGFRLRADEHEAAFLHALGEVRVLRQEAVTGMDATESVTSAALMIAGMLR
jgi:hypothetical protein